MGIFSAITIVLSDDDASGSDAVRWATAELKRTLDKRDVATTIAGTAGPGLNIEIASGAQCFPPKISAPRPEKRNPSRSTAKRTGSSPGGRTSAALSML